MAARRKLIEVIEPFYRIESAVTLSNKIIPCGNEYNLYEKLAFTEKEKNLMKSFCESVF
jgi:hypothetical protein